MWYTGNLKVSSEDLEKKTFDNFAHWARKLSERLSKSGMNREKCFDNGKKPMNGDLTHHAPTRITTAGKLKDFSEQRWCILHLFVSD
ncbi:hypothetical protein QQF64_004256 [Cirrhinus molitorella]|uniref:Uncharacterized protein n=1 Tax=Cirrhinus molitorella TaxID=172907 RepID=A0ABR3MFP7_9TELE